jgi:hypothetical protein
MFRFHCECCGLFHLADQSVTRLETTVCPETGCTTPIANPVPYSEADWPAETDPHLMLQLIEGQVSDRKLRLFACACVRGLLAGKVVEVERVLAMSEQFADGLVSKEQLARAHNQSIFFTPAGASDHPSLLAAAVATATPVAYGAAVLASQYGLRINSMNAHREQQRQATLLREIFGDPFPQTAPRMNILDALVPLGKAVYEQGTSPLLLCNPLVDLGLPDWADHFRSGLHPKGCWVLDAILGLN